MSDAAADRGRLTFGHGRVALVAFCALATLLALLAWLDRSRSARELARFRASLCGELPAELIKALGALSRDAAKVPEAARQALAMLQGLSGEDRYPNPDARILFESVHGWRELRGGGDDLGYSHDPALLSFVRSWRCDATLENNTLRAVRPLQTNTGAVALLVLERSRQ